MYYYRLGRGYGKFYWVGIKAVWFNYQAAKLIRERVHKETGNKVDKSAIVRHLTRSEFQMLERNSHDIGKLPLFGLLTMIVGEWLPLFVPFMPGIVPGTCRIPSQTENLRRKSEERRRHSFRSAVPDPAILSESAPSAAKSTPSSSDQAVLWATAQREQAATLVMQLRDDQLHHLSCVLNLHSRLWDRIQLAPPSFLLRRALAKRFAYLTTDDQLLVKYGGANKLAAEELTIACEERGLDVVGAPHDTLRSQLSWWLARQKEDKGAGRAILAMLFRRLAIRDWVDMNVQANRES